MKWVRQALQAFVFALLVGAFVAYVEVTVDRPDGVVTRSEATMLRPKQLHLQYCSVCTYGPGRSPRIGLVPPPALSHKGGLLLGN
jgi:hypothetical protein